jgi:MinD superfamily P-loop ATPase
MVHARLNPAAENSGKLVTLVRTQAREIAEKEGIPLTIIDGSPGIGCPVIASITAASLVLVVSEPTLSGEHDFKRVMALSEHFQIPTALCINKFDLNPSMAEQIENEARNKNVSIVGRIRYDRLVTTAQVEEKAVVEYDHSPAGEDIKAIWKALTIKMNISTNGDKYE